MQDPSAIFKFIKEHDLDIGCLQEICYPNRGRNELKELLEKDGYYYEEGIHFKYLPKNINLGVAIFSKHPIIDVTRVYGNTEDYQPKEIGNNDFLGEEIIEDDIRQEEFKLSRGIKHSTKSKCILLATIQTTNQLIKVVTTHFNVSDKCTETTQMYEMALLVKSLVEHGKGLPTIFAGDLNIQAKSYSVTKLKEVLECHTEELTDTLSNDHVAKEKDFPDGLAIDHVFSKGLKQLSTNTVDVDFTFHKAVVSVFEV